MKSSEATNTKPIYNEIAINIDTATKIRTIDEYLNKNVLVDPNSEPRKFKKFTELFPNYKIVKINNIDGVQYENSVAGIGTPSQQIITTALPIDKGIFEIIADKEEYRSVYDQILSTFKFIEKDETADWQTYETIKSAIFPSENYTIKYPSDWNYLEKRIAGERKPGKLETVFINNKNKEIIKIIAGDILSNYQDKKYTNKGEENFGNSGYKFLKLEDNSVGVIYYIFNTGENLIADSTQKGYDEIIAFNAMFIDNSVLNNMLSTFKFIN